MSRRAAGSLLLLGATLLLAACHGHAKGALGAAEGFVDSMYVRIDLKAAREHCVGVARSKIDDELRLVGDQRIDATTRKPYVTYELKETRPEGEDRTAFVFTGKIRPSDADPFERRWLVFTQRQPDGTWKVSNFQEFD
jgi:hypothetical protein